MKRYLMGFVLALATVAVPMTVAAQSDARPIALEEAVRLAQRNAPATIQSANAIRSAAGTVRQRYGAFLPNLSMSAGLGNSQGSRLVQVPDPNNPGNFTTEVRPFEQDWVGNHGLNSSLQLFGGGQRYFQLKQAQAQLDVAEAADIAQEYQVTLQVKQQYFAVLAAREQRAAADRQLESAEQQLRASTARVQAGAATRSDSLRTSIQVGNARLAILQADNGLANANAALSRLVGSEVLVTAAGGDTDDAGSIASSDEEIYALIERSPAVVQAKATQTAARQGTRSNWGQYLPSLSVSMGRSYNGQTGNFQIWGDPRLQNTRTNFSINFTLFDGLGREQQMLQANIARDNAEASLRNARLEARQNLIQQIGAFRTAEARVQIQLSSVAAGEEDLRVQQERYSLGASTLLDVLNSQTTLDNARRDLIQARLDARTAKAQIEALIGRDL